MPRRPLVRRVGFALLAVAGLAFAGAAGAGLWLNARLQGSLPVLDGEIAVAGALAEGTGLEHPARIERDQRGRATIVARTRRDLAFATGFLHGQERFFQMDLTRRRSAGELAALIGEGALGLDRATRVHRFRRVAREAVAAAPPEHRALIAAYTRGVNAGLAALDKPPFEYAALRVDPSPWLDEDVALVLLSKFVLLQGGTWRTEAALGTMRDTLPPALFAFLGQSGTTWDSPIDGTVTLALPAPGPDVVDLRAPAPAAARAPATSRAPRGAAAPQAQDEHPVLGSNAWLVGAARTATGGALVANDMHLPLAVPPVWLYASLVLEDAGGRETRRFTGVTLPGAPALVVGSTGTIAWGFTNSYSDAVDLVVVEPDPAAPEERYLTPDGPRAFEQAVERIDVARGDSVDETITLTMWGPVIGEDAQGRPLALRWTAHDPRAVNLALLDLESAATVDEAIAIAQRSGIPVQNFHVGDASGRIAWTPMGLLPRRFGFSGTIPESWADGTRGWSGYLEGAEIPAVVDPAEGLIWTANSRVVGGDALRTIGDGGYALGARARQIRDGLRAIPSASVADMLAVQLDDRALFLERWQQLLLATLDDDALAADPRRAEARALVEQWGARASVDSVGYRLVRAFRNTAVDLALEPLFAPCAAADDGFSTRGLRQLEGPAWTLLETRPMHLLDPAYESWDALLLAAFDRVLDELTKDGRPLAERTWGEFNTYQARHPLSLAVPMLSRYLDLPALSLPGDGRMPRVQGRSFGSSQRMVVTPGREAEGIFHMPGGQSGHPLSPFYGSEERSWAEGESTPFLPGPALHTLRLIGRSS